MTTMGDGMWARFCRVIDRPEWQDDPRFNPDSARGQLYESVIRPALEAWAREKPRSEVVELVRLADLPPAPLQHAPGLFDCPTLAARSQNEGVDCPHPGPLKSQKL